MQTLVYYCSGGPALCVFSESTSVHCLVLVLSVVVVGLLGPASFRVRLFSSDPRAAHSASICGCQFHLCEAVASAATALVVLGCLSSRCLCLAPAWSGGVGRWFGGWGGERGWVFRESKSVLKQLASMQQDKCIHIYI